MKICKFIEGSFMPSFDGASQKFEHITKNLSSITDLTVIHCYRGWSDLNVIKKQNFITFAIPPTYYYYNFSVINKIISSVKPDLIEMNDPELLVSTGLYLSNKFKIPLVYDAHFVSSVLVKKITNNNSISIPEESIEKIISQIVSGATCFTDIDKQDLLRSTQLEPKRIRVIPFGANFDEIRYRNTTRKDNVILFLGNMYFQPNQEAVEMIVNEIAPLVLNKNKNLIFKFVGDVPSGIVNKYNHKNIIFEGRLDDINKAFENVGVCISPVRIGGGVRVKILTYMASGAPIISSKAAVAGIKYKNFINIAETPQEFADKILDIFKHPSRYYGKSQAAYKEAFENHSWNKIAYKNVNFYKSIIKNPVYSSLKPQKLTKEPYWLEETIQRGRFKNIKINNNFGYVLGKGRIQKKQITDL